MALEASPVLVFLVILDRLVLGCCHRFAPTANVMLTGFGVINQIPIDGDSGEVDMMRG
jgi:flagellar biosynthesis protein FliR